MTEHKGGNRYDNWGIGTDAQIAKLHIEKKKRNETSSVTWKRGIHHLALFFFKSKP